MLAPVSPLRRLSWNPRRAPLKEIVRGIEAHMGLTC